MNLPQKKSTAAPPGSGAAPEEAAASGVGAAPEEAAALCLRPIFALSPPSGAIPVPQISKNYRIRLGFGPSVQNAYELLKVSALSKIAVPWKGYIGRILNYVINNYVLHLFTCLILLVSHAMLYFTQLGTRGPLGPARPTPSVRPPRPVRPPRKKTGQY